MFCCHPGIKLINEDFMKPKFLLFLMFFGCLATSAQGQKPLKEKNNALRLALKMEKPKYDAVMSRINEYNTRILSVLTDSSKTRDQKNSELAVLRGERKKYIDENLSSQQQKTMNDFSASRKSRAPYKNELKNRKPISEEQFRSARKPNQQ
jgi:hypothetical protein